MLVNEQSVPFQSTESVSTKKELSNKEKELDKQGKVTNATNIPGRENQRSAIREAREASAGRIQACI